MTVFGPHFALLASITTGVGFVMCRAGIGVGHLVRREARRCQCCGRALESGFCPRCG